MSRNLKLFLSLILIAFNSSGFGQIKEVIKISGAFSDFNKAVEKKNAADAIDCLDEATISYFSLVFPQVKNFNASSADSTFIQNKSFITWLHENISAEEISNTKADEFFGLLINKGLLLKLNLSRFHPGQISLNGDKGKALLTTFSTPEQTQCTFNKEGKKWKLNLPSVIQYLVTNIK